MHQQNILHRDIKPANIFLTQDETVKIGDLGIARELSCDSACAHSMVGTPYYLSPELCEGKGYNEKSDMWAFGCVIYEMAAGKRPFEAGNQAALVVKIMRARPPPLPPCTSPAIVQCVQSCLQKEPSHRPTAARLLAKLHRSMQPLQPSAQLQSKAPAPSQHPPQTSHNRHQPQNQPISRQRPASALASVRRSAAQDPQRQQFKVNPVPSWHIAGAPSEASAAEQLAMHAAEVAPPLQSHHHVPVKPASSPSASTCAAVTGLPRNVTPAQRRLPRLGDLDDYRLVDLSHVVLQVAPRFAAAPCLSPATPSRDTHVFERHAASAAAEGDALGRNGLTAHVATA